MKDYFYVNPSKMIELCKTLSGSEIKMVYAIMYCLAGTGERLFANSEKNRSTMAKIGFSKTPERISTLLSSLVKKGVINREAYGLFSLPEDLFINPNISSEINS